MKLWRSTGVRHVKILMVNKFLHPNGGSETYVFELGKQLQKEGHRVEYFGMEHEGRIVGNRAGSYTADLDFHTGRLVKFLYPFKIIYSQEARKKIRKVLIDFRPDIVHINNFNFQLTPSIIYEIRKFEKQTSSRIKIIFTAHDYQLSCPNHMMRIPGTGENCERCRSIGFRECIRNRCIHGSLTKSLLGSLEGWLYDKLGTYKNFDCLICPSRFMEEKLCSIPLFRGKTIVMHNFVDKEACMPADKKDYVLYFGRLSKEKGIETLLEVCAKLSNIPFVFAGTGPLEAEVRKKDNIKYIGFQRGEELVKWIAEASFSVYPSEWYENCPFSVMESITYGTPVIGADIGGIQELILAGKTGELFRSGNAKELEEKIRKMWNDRTALDKYTDNCREKSFDTVEEYCRKLIGIYEKIQ